MSDYRDYTEEFQERIEEARDIAKEAKSKRGDPIIAVLGKGRE